MLGDIIHAATGFAGILAAPAQIKQQWLPAWESQPGRLSAFLFLGCQHRGFVPLSWSDQFHRGVGLGTGQASSFPSSYFISHRRRPPPPVSLSIALFFVCHKPQSPCCPRTWSWTGSLLSSYFSLFFCRGSRDQRAAQGPKVTLAGRCSIWLLEVLWPWWCEDGHGCPQGEGGSGLGAKELHLLGGP